MTNKIKIIILYFIFCSSFLFPSNSTEYSIGLNDKLGYLGPFGKSWIKEKDNKESYIVVGGLGIIGGVGYGQKYYFSKGIFEKVSWRNLDKLSRLSNPSKLSQVANSELFSDRSLVHSFNS